MTQSEARQILRQYNAWRRDSEGKVEAVSPMDIGIAIDVLAQEPPKDLASLAFGLEGAIGASPQSRETITDYLMMAANWQAEQIYKEAVVKYATIYFERMCDAVRIMVDFDWLDKKESDFNPGDKVKVVITKEK